MSACLDEDTLLGLVEGRLSASALDAAEAHLDECESCSAVVAQLARANAPAKRELERGQQLGKYVVGELLGAGAMGGVYSAWQPDLDRRVAIKVLHDDTAGTDRLLEEAQAMARLDHPNVVGVYEVGTLPDGGVYVVMDLVEGDTLRAWAETTRDWREIVRVLIEIARGLAAVHAAGVIHRDIKPDNIIVGSDGRARLGDFGLARGAGTKVRASKLADSVSFEDTVVATPSDRAAVAGVASPVGASRTAVAGTPVYMARELLKGGAATAASDQFAFGVTAYEVIAGKRPFTGKTWGELAAAVEKPPSTLRDVPGWLDVAIRRCLALDPEKRFPSMAAVADHLDEGARRRKPIWIAGVAVAAMAASAVTWGAARGGEVAPSGPSCAIGANEIAAVWNPSVRASVESLGTPALAAIDGWTAKWASEHDATCEAAKTAPLAKTTARERCLARQRDELAALLDRSRQLLASAHTTIDDQRTNGAGEVPATGDSTVPDRDVASTSGVDPVSGGAGDSTVPDRDIASASGVDPDRRAVSGGAGDSTARHRGVASASGVDPDRRAVSGGAGDSTARHRGVARDGRVASGLSDGVTIRDRGDVPDTAGRLLDAIAAMSPADCRQAEAGTADPLPADPHRAGEARSVERELPKIRAAIALGDARPVVELSAAVVERARNSTHAPSLAEALLARGEALRATDRLDDAATAARDAVAAAERGHDDQTAARAWLLRVGVALDRRDLAAADDLGAIADGAVDRAGSPPRLVAQLLELRGVVAYYRNRFDDARALLAKARPQFAALSGEKSTDVARIETVLGTIARASGDLVAAEQHHRAALVLDRELRGPDHFDISRDLHNLAGVLRLKKDLDAAAATYQQALAIEVAKRGERSAQAGLTHNSLGLVKLERGDLPGARAEFSLARDILTAANHGDRAFAIQNLGLVAAAAGDHATALAEYDRAAALFTATIGDTALAAIRVHLDRARSYLALGRRDQARTSATRAIDSATQANIPWIVDDAKTLLAKLAPVATRPIPARQDPPDDPRSVVAPIEKPQLPPVPDPPVPIRDVGSYGSNPGRP